MSDYRPLDATADVLPVGLQLTPFGEVWQALQQVAAGVWDVDPSVYRAGMAWLWYAVNHPDDLASDSLRALLVAALISEQAPMVKDWQTNAELVEYLRVWRAYSPTYAKLEAIFAAFGARVEVRPISDAESQSVVPVADRRLAFYLRVEEFDAARPLTLDEVYQIAVRATPLGARPVPYFALVGSSDVFAAPASAGLVRALWASEPAEPYTPPTPPYTEITLYMVNGNKRAQNGVTSAFTGNVNSTYCYQLYTDAECTTPWNAYDYSNNYELVYNGVVIGLQKVSDLPSTTVTSGASLAYILMDTGSLWLASNMTGSGYQQIVFTTIALRIYPKAQQHYVRYMAYNNAYNNTTVTTATKGTYPAPTNGTSSNYSGWFSTFPKATITRLLMSAGNEAQSLSGDELYTSSDYRFYFRQASAASRTFRAIEYTLDRPTLHAWLNPNHTNVSTLSVQLYDLYDDNGNKLMFDGDFSVVYVPIGLFVSSGANCSSNQLTLERAKFGRRSTGEWCIIQNYTTVSIARVWYVKYTDCKVAYFNANKSNYTWTVGTTRVLYDADGNQIPYDSTKTYTIIQLREASHSVITPTFGDMALKSLINNSGYLACNYASGGTYSSLSVASVWYLEE